MKQVIVIAGASSGFGALAARALAKSGHTVWTGMRDAAVAGHQLMTRDAARYRAYFPKLALIAPD
jgi:NADP-dependent 3-hydroxy acid dehydrogenase YdfG